MNSMCTTCLRTGRNLEIARIKDNRMRKFFLELIKDFMEYELLATLPRLCKDCYSKLSRCLSFKEQAIHSYMILGQMHYEELTENQNPDLKLKTERSAQTEPDPSAPKPDAEALLRIEKLKMQNQNLLRLLKRLQIDSRLLTNATKTKCKDHDETSDSEQKSPKSPLATSSLLNRDARSPPTSPKAKRKCEPNEALNRIKILDVRVLSEEFKLLAPKGETVQSSNGDGPIVTSTRSLRDQTKELENVESEITADKDQTVVSEKSVVSEISISTDVVIEKVGSANDFQSDEEATCVIADDDPIWEDLDMDIGYPELNMKTEALESEVDQEEWQESGREQSVTPVTDDLMPDLQDASELSDSEASESSEAPDENGKDGEASDIEEDLSDKMDLSEYCDKSPVVILNDILKTPETEQPNSTLLEVRPSKRKRRAKVKKHKEEAKEDCSNCPHCIFMKSKVGEGYRSDQLKGLMYKNGRFIGKSVGNQKRKCTRSEMKLKRNSSTKSELKRKERTVNKTPRLAKRANGVNVRKLKRRRRGTKWTVKRNKKVDMCKLKCMHCEVLFDSEEELKAHVFEVVGADVSMESVKVCEVDYEAAPESSLDITERNQEPTSETLTKDLNKKLLVVVEDVNNSNVETVTDKPELLSCNHCEKTFKTQKKLRDHILDIVLSDCNKSLDELWQK